MTNVPARVVSKDFLPHFISFPPPTPFSSQAQSRGLHWSHGVVFEPQVNSRAALAAELPLLPAPRRLPVRSPRPPSQGSTPPGLVCYRARELGSLAAYPPGAISFLPSHLPSPLVVIVEVLEHRFHVIFSPPFSWTVPAPLAVRSWLLFSVSASLYGQMHTNAFRSPQDKAWTGLPHGRNVSSPPARAGVRAPPLPTPWIR